MSRCYKLSPEEQDKFEQLDNDKDKLAFLEVLSKKTMGEESFPREDITNIPEPIETFPGGGTTPDNNDMLYELLFNPSKIHTWGDEQAGVAQALIDHPDIAKMVDFWTNPILKAHRVEAEIKWVNGTDEDRQATLKAWDMKKDLFVVPWKDLSEYDKSILTLAEIPDESLHFSLFDNIANIKTLAEFEEERTGILLHSEAQRIQDLNSLCVVLRDIAQIRVLTDPHFKNIKGDEAAEARINQIVESNNPNSGVEKLKDATPQEIACADAISAVYKSFEPAIRFKRVTQEAGNDIESFKKEFPDAVDEGKEEELAIALKLKQMGNDQDLWDYLQDKDWGVIQEGYSPRKRINYGLYSSSNRDMGVRGKSILQARTQLKYIDTNIEPSPFRKLASYVEDVTTQLILAPEIKRVQSMWELMQNKFDPKSRSYLQKGLSNWIDRLQHVPIPYDPAANAIRKLWLQQMRAVFSNPILSVRNLLQGIALGYDRLELVKTVTVSMVPADIKALNQLFFDTYVSNLGGIRKDMLGSGEKLWHGTFNPLRTLNPVNSFAERVTKYDTSDYIPRHNTFNGQFEKAYRATQVYLKDGNLKKWISNSGVLHLRNTEKNYAMTHYLGQIGKTFDTGRPGLNSIPADIAVCQYIAQTSTDKVNFPMGRSNRALMEMGVHGLDFWNLIVYPKNYAWRYWENAEKIYQAFKGETTWEDARGSISDIWGLILTGAILGAGWCSVTGKKNNPFDALGSLTGWQFGGMLVSSGQVLFAAAGAFITAVNPASTSDERKLALSQLEQNVIKEETLVPFLPNFIDILDVLTGTEGIDKNTLGQLRHIFQSSYTPQQTDKINRSLWEKIQKVFSGAKTPPLSILDKTQQDFNDEEDQLGTIPLDSKTGQLYTLLQFGNSIESETSTIPRVEISKDNGFSDLVLFYLDCKDDWSDYFNLLTADERTNWCKAHPAEEAMMRFWGKKSKSVFTAVSEGGKTEANLLAMWTSLYGITESSEPSADWQDFVKVPD